MFVTLWMIRKEKKRKRYRKDQRFKGVILIQDRSSEGREEGSHTDGMMCVFAFVFTSVGHRRS